MSEQPGSRKPPTGGPKSVRSMKARELLSLLAVAILSVSAAALLLTSILSGSQTKYAAIADHLGRTQGTVYRVDFSNHGTIYFRYVVAGTQYDSGSQFDAPNLMESPAPGDAVVIFYDTSSPGRAVAFDPRPRLASNRNSVVAGAFFMGAILTYGFYSHQRRRATPR